MTGRRIMAGFVMAALGVLAGERAHAAPAVTRPTGQTTPFPVLFDTGEFPTKGLAAAGMSSAARGWKLVPADTASLRFLGDVVMANDKLVIVLPKGGAGAHLYTRNADALTSRGVLAPADAEDGLILSAATIAENSLAAVALQATFKSKDGGLSVFTFRLTTGAMMVKVTAGAGAKKLCIEQCISYVIVPDYFAADAVVWANPRGPDRAGLPTENCLMSLLTGGDAISVCLWQHPANAEAVCPGKGGIRGIQGVEIGCSQGATLWVAMLERPGIWYSQELGPTSNDVELSWKRPFEAKWRCDVVSANLLAQSLPFRAADYDSASAKDSPRCWFDSGKAFVHRPLGSKSGHPGSANAATAIIYPIDRDVSTPLTAFCVVDAMRAALGTGPCQYVLDTEGLGNNSQATPDVVGHWIEEQFKKGKAKQQSAILRQRLDQLTRHVEGVEGRIADYARKLEQVKAFCEKEATSPGARLPAQQVLAILEESQTVRPAPEGLAKVVTRLAEEILALAEKNDSLAACQKMTGQILSVGATQDRAMAVYRMTSRRIVLLCRGAEGPGPAALAVEIQKLMQPVLTTQPTTPTQPRGDSR